MNISPLAFSLGILLVVALSGWGCGDETVSNPQPVAVTNEPLITDAREGEDGGQQLENAQASAAEGGPSVADNAPASPNGDTPQPDGELSPIEQDAQMYAQQFGVSQEEAVTRLTLQDSIGELGAEIESNESATFAGLWIQHKPEYRVVVAFTKDGEATIAKYVQGGALAELIEVRTADATLRELEKAQRDVGRLADGLGFSFASGINVMENRVELYASRNRAELEKALREAGKELPTHVVIIGQ